ncbi:hypothetical protein GCM10008927_24750 [Amylibacter ulvae]|uniref:Uncharacterized protein n=1 Tax=Paramylibacter ulvae TaxID=1651968 RepID=A0ABQ3D6J6_9RHOB|nr:hypothetical protein [Amylibacter ulvae]GHA58016.1 hypothetical protein GCM10008927_24750 [Amylibacter ulvae]
MNFIRPELREILLQWREVILLVAIMLVSLVFFATGGTLVRIITLGLFVIGAGFLYPAIRQARTAVSNQSVGVVEISERRIRYLSPDMGAEISANELMSVEIESRDVNSPMEDVAWIFRDKHGYTMRIPSGAEGARGLLDAISSLPGADLDAVVRAMGYPQKALFTIWKKN